LFGDDQRRMVKTINGQQDSTFLHNGLAFGLFRDFDGDGSPRRAPFVRPAEIFVNGRYHGLFELCTQIDETLAGGAVPGAEVPSPLVIYRHETVPPRDPVMRVSRPTTRNGSQMGPYLDLEASLAGLDTSGRVSVLEQRVEIDSVIDLQLLLNLMQNDNGTPFPYLAHDALVYRGGTNGTFFHVLWDFDRGLTRDWSWIANAMMRDLEAGSPAYRERLARRWFLLREGVLGTDAVLARLAALAVPLDGYVVWDRQRWPHPAMRPHAKDIENTRRALRQNLAHMDHFLADWRGHGGEVGALAAEETETGKIK
ncbi:MAG: CotH kinase family protein, partial [Verrucomicrobia bacterium]|nr:CotH kinase family protein [Verrucomicrobiota bacterium]